MTQINPFTGAIIQSGQVQPKQSAEKDRQIRRLQNLGKNAALQGDHLEHQVESSDALHSTDDRGAGRHHRVCGHQPRRLHPGCLDNAGDWRLQNGLVASRTSQRRHIGQARDGQFIGRQDPGDFAGAILITPSMPGRYTVFGRVISKVNGLVSTWVSGFADGT